MTRAKEYYKNEGFDFEDDNNEYLVDAENNHYSIFELTEKFAELRIKEELEKR